MKVTLIEIAEIISFSRFSQSQLAKINARDERAYCGPELSRYQLIFQIVFKADAPDLTENGLKTRVRDTELPTRIANIIYCMTGHDGGITLEEILDLTYHDLMSHGNFGEKSKDILKKELAKYGAYLKEK